MYARRNVAEYTGRLMLELHVQNTVHTLHRSCSTRVGTLQQRKTIGPRGWVLLGIPVLTFALGTWQVQRRKWKLNLIQELEKRSNAEPREFPEDLTELKEIEYYPVRVRGHFDHSKELFLGPRSLIKDGDAASEGKLISKNAKSHTGYCVITPFQLSDKNFTILVNRGWVPYDKRNPASRRGGQIEDEVELVGIVRLEEKRPPFTPHNKGNMWFYRDLSQMSAATDAAPVLLDAVVESSVDGGPLGGQTRVSLRNEHFSYILTWYSLSALTGIMWLRMFVFR
ncbi:SURF1-like protein [Gryllus bimaculatus]|nr:SURF1-like protein [Gryllus bimaculatus]